MPTAAEILRFDPDADTTPRRDRCASCKVAQPFYVLCWEKQCAARYACESCARRSEAYAQLLGVSDCLMVLPIWAWLGP